MFKDIIRNNQVVGVVDTFFGDSGKGKIIDYLASQKEKEVSLFQIAYRPNGGPNTGHTVKIGDRKKVFHLLPSAVLLPQIKCYLGKGVIFEPDLFLEEVKDVNNVLVDSQAHVIMPYHVALDNLRELSNVELKIGTTGKGVGPCIETRDSRKGYVTVEMLTAKNSLKSAVTTALDKLNPEIKSLISILGSDANRIIESLKISPHFKVIDFYKNGNFNIESILSAYSSLGEKLLHYTTDDVAGKVRTFRREGNNILVEGTQGALLDITHGTYPYVTSGLTTRPGLEHEAGIEIDLVINVNKAYATRVGNGPFPTEIKEQELAEKIRITGSEYGSTTGRPRRIGWLDILALNYALDLNCRKNEKRYLALTKLDVLNGIEPLLCTKYLIDGDIIFNYSPSKIERAIALYENFPSIGDVTKIGNLDDLIGNSYAYVKAIERLTNSSILLFGNGPERNDVLI